MNKIVLILSLFFFFGMYSLHAYTPNTVIINDQVNILSVEDKNTMNLLIQDLKNNYGSEIAILLVNDTGNQTIENYSLNYANVNKIGRANYYDGILITVSMASRQVRIEVGYGLEKIIRDEVAGEIIRNVISPDFKKEQYGNGLINAIHEIVYKIKANNNLIGNIDGIKVSK